MLNMNYREENSANNRAEESGMSSHSKTVYIIEKPSESASEEKHFEKMFPSKIVTVLAILQIVAGGLAIVSEVVVLLAPQGYKVSTGIWCGIVFEVSGLVGLFTAFRPTSCRFVSFMVMSIISTVLCIPLLFFPSLFMNEAKFSNQGELLVTFYVIEILLAVFMAIVAIVSSAFSCRAVCCRRTYLGSPIIRAQAVVADGDQLRNIPDLSTGARSNNHHHV